ncbi:MAG: KpsF/GutQ family sugar-phosphate isomerase [Candidatus Nanoarchaeia archaeon]
MKETKEALLDIAREVLDTEIEGLCDLRKWLGEDFEKLVNKCIEILDNGGKIVISGVGKSGHVGHKIAATLASTGAPAVFMHPVEAMHGDMGILQKNDILIAISYSGESDEIVSILPSAKRLDIPVAAITGATDSRLARWSDIVVPMPIRREACPFNLAPTTSTTVLIALGDALAITLLKLRGFTKEDYGRLHPGGAIGKAITLKVSDVMRTGDRLVLVSPNTSVKETLLQMTKSRSGSAIVVSPDSKLLGIFTDGDFRRHVDGDMKILEKPVSSVMTPNPTAVKKDDLAVEILKIIEKRHIDDIIVLDQDNNTVVGLVDVQDLPGLKLL